MSGEHHLRKTIQKSLTGAAICGAGALVGGLIGGPIGIGIGSAFGASVGAAALGFRPILEVVQHDLTPTQRQSLMERGRRALTDSKELILSVVLDIITAIFKCRSKKEAMELLLPYIERGIAFILREFIRYLSA